MAALRAPVRLEAAAAAGALLAVPAGASAEASAGRYDQIASKIALIVALCWRAMGRIKLGQFAQRAHVASDV